MIKGKCAFCKSKRELEQHHIIPKRYGNSIGCIHCCADCHSVADKLSDIIIKQIYHNRLDIQKVIENMKQREKK